MGREPSGRELDTPLLFPGQRGGYLNLHNWRRDDWNPAVRAAGLEQLTPYAMRHTYAAFAIGAGVSLFALARRMGTSVERSTRPTATCFPMPSTTSAACSTRSTRPQTRRRKHMAEPRRIIVLQEEGKSDPYGQGSDIDN
jgi:hypothetical protein